MGYLWAYVVGPLFYVHSEHGIKYAENKLLDPWQLLSLVGVVYVVTLCGWLHVLSKAGSHHCQYVILYIGTVSSCVVAGCNENG